MVKTNSESIGYIIATERKGGYGSGIRGHRSTNGSSDEAIARVSLKPPKKYRKEIDERETNAPSKIVNDISGAVSFLRDIASDEREANA